MIFRCVVIRADIMDEKYVIRTKEDPYETKSRHLGLFPITKEIHLGAHISNKPNLLLKLVLENKNNVTASLI